MIRNRFTDDNQPRAKMNKRSNLFKQQPEIVAP